MVSYERVGGRSEVMKKQRISNDDQVLRLLCLAAFVEISSLAV